MDQSGVQAITPCYAKVHNHTKGGGSYGAQGAMKMFAAIRAALRAIDSEAMLSGEVPPEGLLSTIDLHLSHFNVWPGAVPLFASIYSGHWTGFGRTITLTDQFAAGAGLKARVANMLASGSTFGRLWLDHWWLPQFANQTAYLQQHVSFRRDLSRYFVHGYLQRPVDFTIVSGPRNVSLVPAPELKHNLTLDSLVASMWVSSDETELGVMLSNLAEDELTVTASVELKRTALTMEAGSRREVSRLTYVSIDQPLAAASAGTIRGPSSQWRIRETLAVGEAVFLRMANAQRGLW